MILVCKNFFLLLLSLMKDRKQEIRKRQHRITIMLNDDEQKVLNKYCADYNIENRSNYIREVLFQTLLKKIEQDYPTLFEQEIMDELIQKK